MLDLHSLFNFKWLARQCLPHPENELRQLQDSRVVITRHDDMMLLFQSNFLAQCLGISELDDRIKFPRVQPCILSRQTMGQTRRFNAEKSFPQQLSRESGLRQAGSNLSRVTLARLKNLVKLAAGKH